MEVKCPGCGQKTLFAPENPYRPFCSERCRLIDLGQWASETYRVASDDKFSIQELAESATDEEDTDAES